MLIAALLCGTVGAVEPDLVPWGVPPYSLDPWDRFLRHADRVVAGTVRTVRVVPHPRFHTLTEIVIDVDEVLMGSVSGDTVTAVQAYDGTRPGPHFVAAPHEGDSVVLTMAPWVRDPTLLALHRYVGSTTLEDGRVVTVDRFRNLIGSIDCEIGPTEVDVASLLPPPTLPRSPWDGPDPQRIAARKAAALDWSVARPKLISCLRAQLGGK